MRPGWLSIAMMVCSTASICCAAPVEQRETQVELVGIHLGQPLQEARRALDGKASFEKEEEGQQVWRMLHDPSTQYVIFGANRENQVRYVTTLAATDGPPMACPPLGDVSTAVKTGAAGNMELRREVKQAGENLTIIARGKSPEHLSSCSIKAQGSGFEQDEEEEEQREKSKHR